ncbi:MAG: dTMP kinase [Verrucomicrobia bacterium RIFCSPHIGHO2_12_FULL_41_10]|nr:MAG: dTMP kinase [Verrucomicrobia bacterium RIFCSPHIGHO2_12_FULL_41_10]
MNNGGFFITFEGSEGCGKSTQIARLAEFFQKGNVTSPSREVLLLREPGGTGVGEQIRSILQYAPESAAMAPETELLLFAASRAQLVREIIRPALSRGAIVLCDRFLDSTTVYQGVARALNQEEVTWMNQFATGGTLPNITILLDLEVAIGRKRMVSRNANSSTMPDRIEQESEVFFEAIRHGYLTLAEQEPDRIIVIDASGSADEVTEKILSKLKALTHIL